MTVLNQWRNNYMNQSDFKEITYNRPQARGTRASYNWFLLGSTLYRTAVVPAPKTYRTGLSFTHKTPISDRFLSRSDAALLRSWKWIVTYRIGFRDTFLSTVNRESNRKGSQQRGARIGFWWKDGGGFGPLPFTPGWSIFHNGTKYYPAYCRHSLKLFEKGLN